MRSDRRPVTLIECSARTFGCFGTRVPVGYLNGYPGTRCFG